MRDRETDELPEPHHQLYMRARDKITVWVCAVYRVYDPKCHTLCGGTNGPIRAGKMESADTRSRFYFSAYVHELAYYHLVVGKKR